MGRLTRITIILLLAVSCVMSAVAPAWADATIRGDATRAGLAVTWLRDQLQDGALQQFEGHKDYGLTLDAVLGMRAAGVPASELRPILHAMVGITEIHLQYDGQPTTGLVGKALVAGNAVGYPVDDFHGVDLVTVALGAIDELGRVDGGPNDAENIFSQSFVVMGLAQQDELPVEAVEFLLSQQCAAGYFRLYYSDGLSCDAADGVYDVDGTVIALFALEAALALGHDDVSPALESGRAWLLAEQGSSGGFAGAPATPSENSNSTGLAAAALSGHHPEAAAQASRWVADRFHSSGPDRGSVAYRAADHEGWEPGAALNSAQRSGAIRATPQAILAFAPVSYASFRPGFAVPARPTATSDVLFGLFGIIAHAELRDGDHGPTWQAHTRLPTGATFSSPALPHPS